MAFHNNCITMVGNLTDDPELRFTPSGAPVCNLRIASNRRWTGRDGTTQEETTFVNVTAWRDLGENIAETLHKGDRVVVIGRLQIRSYDDREGVTRWVTEIVADEVAPSLRWAKASISKTAGRTVGASSGADGGAGSGGGDFGGDGDGPPDDDVPF